MPFVGLVRWQNYWFVNYGQVQAIAKRQSSAEIWRIYCIDAEQISVFDL